jgi:UDP-N-acetylglucosamine acyltransferase
METVVGRNCLLMASSHVAHDCCLGDNVILANAATLGGHVVLGSYVTIGGLSAIHQFVRVGEHAMIGGTAGIVGDVIPYGMVNPEGKLNGLNITGLKRRDFSKETIQALRKAYHYLFSSGTATIADRLNSLSKDLLSYTPVQNLINFISKEERRPLCLP